MQIVGIMGDSGAGKDTLARALTAVQPSSVVRCADPLRESTLAVLRANGYDGPFDMDDRGLKDQPREDIRAAIGHMLGDEAPTLRNAMRVVALEMRKGAPTCFSDAMAWRVRAACNRGLVAVPDIRYPQEWKAIKALGGMLVRVVKLGLPPSSLPEEIEARLLPVDHLVVWRTPKDLLMGAVGVFRYLEAT